MYMDITLAHIFDEFADFIIGSEVSESWLTLDA